MPKLEDGDVESACLQGHKEASYGATDDKADDHFQGLFRAKSYNWIDDKVESEEVVFDASFYDLNSLLYWDTFKKITGSALDQKSTWTMITRMFMVATFCAIGTCLTPAISPHRAKGAANLGSFLNVFMGMLLGFFISFSVERWFQCASSFLSLLDAVRNMQMQFFALGVSKARTDRVCRYGCLSARLLFKYHDKDIDRGPEDNLTKNQRIWDELEEECPGLVWSNERKCLEKSITPYGLIWTWQASLIGRMAQDGEIPPMPSPTYGRIINLVQDAFGSIRDVGQFVTVQIPYIYTHTLAMLVHFNNILNAVNLGITVGITIRITLESYGFVFVRWTGLPEDTIVKPGEVTGTVENVMVAFLMSCLCPVLYHTLLTVAFCFAQPFSSYHTRLPVLRFMKNLEKDLHESAVLAENPPFWEKPTFKKP